MIYDPKAPPFWERFKGGPITKRMQAHETARMVQADRAQDLRCTIASLTAERAKHIRQTRASGKHDAITNAKHLTERIEELQSQLLLVSDD